MSLSLKYYDTPALRLSQMHTQSSGAQSFSDAQWALAGRVGVPLATPETGGWPLDGSRRLVEVPPRGYWWSAQRSDAAGELAQPAVMTLTLDVPVTTTGITFTFWPATNQWCSRMKVSWYSGTVLLRQSEVYPDSPRWTLRQTVESFDKLRIELCATNLPGQYAKMEKLELGQVWQFQQEDLVSVEMFNEIDPMFSDLTVDTMRVSLHNPSAEPLMPAENQRLVLCRDDAPIATHYITDSSRESRDTYTLRAQSGIGLQEGKFLGGMYQDEWADILISDICQGLDLVFTPNVTKLKVSGYLPICTRRQALQQVAFAIGAVITTDAEGALYVRLPSQAVEGVFQKKNIFEGAKVITRPRYSRIEVSAHSYTPSQQEQIIVDGEEVHGSNVLLTFDKPHCNYSISGGELIDSGANFICVKADGPITVSAQEYIHYAQVHGVDDPRADYTERKNVLHFDDATLVTGRNVQAVLQRLYATAQLRQTVEMDAVVTGQKAGQLITTDTPWGNQTQGYLSAMDSRLTAKGQVASIKLVGTERESRIICYYSGELFSADEEVLY